MARIPRLYRVRAVIPGQKTKTYHYQTPRAAEQREEKLVAKFPAAIVTVTPSHPIAYPQPSGDPTPMDLPDALVDRRVVDEFLLELGVRPDAATLVILSGPEVVVEYQPDPLGKAAPKLHRVAYSE